MLSRHLLFGLPRGLVPCSRPYTRMSGKRRSSIRTMCPMYISRRCWTSWTVSASIPTPSLMLSLRRLSFSENPEILRRTDISKTRSFHLSSSLRLHVSALYNSIERTNDLKSNSFVTVVISDAFHIVCSDLATLARPIRRTISSDALLLLVSFPPRFRPAARNATLPIESMMTCFCFEKHCVSVLAALMCSHILLPSHCMLLTIVCKSLLDSACVAMSSAKCRLLMV